MGGVRVLLCIFCVLQGAQLLDADLITDEGLAKVFVTEANGMLSQKRTEYYHKYWAYYTNLTDYNSQQKIEAGLTLAEFEYEAGKNASKFDWKNFQDEDLKRQFSKIAIIGTAILPPDKLEQREKLGANMTRIYSTGKVCNRPGNYSASECFPLDPDLTQIMATSRDWEELQWAWKGWRDVTGKKMKHDYKEFISLTNEAAEMEDFEDGGDYWRSWYEIDNFEEQMATLWEQVKPMYQQLHTYVRRKLKEKYASHANEFPSTGHIPAHILGNMWAQSWAGLNNFLLPFPDKPSLDVTDALNQQGYNATTMFKLAEEFFTSLGLESLPQEFWEHSMITKPTDGRDVVCHASAWDFYNGKDFRIKQCTEMNMRWLETTHHELGHIQYYLQYNHLPVVYRRGANPGFHEAVGDVMSLSSSTPEHLKEIGLLEEIIDDQGFDLNYLMLTALDKIAFLPFGYLMDQWRWKVFNGETTVDEYTTDWWKLRCLHQGISPPIMRTEDDFDPGAKFHIPNNTPYVRYFVSFVIQFQFHKSLCEAANITRPLHRCDIYRSTEAGKLLGDMLKLGSSKPWPDAMEAITGQREMDATPLVEYFKPLTDWLAKQNEGHKLTWDDECPQGSFPPPSSEPDPNGAMSLHQPQLTILAIVFLLISLIYNRIV